MGFDEITRVGRGMVRAAARARDHRARRVGAQPETEFAQGGRIGRELAAHDGAGLRRLEEHPAIANYRVTHRGAHEDALSSATKS